MAGYIFDPVLYTMASGVGLQREGGLTLQTCRDHSISTASHTHSHTHSLPAAHNDALSQVSSS